MLVLSRKSQESVVIGTSEADRKLVVTVLEIRGGKVILGFDAPVNIPINRLEVWERIHLNATT
jgi:carbon storage regulator CsrA